MTTRFAHGMVLGKFYPLHAGHSHLIEEALLACERVTVLLLATHAETIPLDVRAAWIREQHPDAHLVAAYDDAPVDFDDPVAWDVHMRLVDKLLGSPVDAVFTSDAYGEEMARRLDAAWVQVDPGRHEIPVSGTAVRADPWSQWRFLSPPVRAWYARRVAIVGAESTGTTTLARALAARLECPWVPEYGREWTEIRPGGLQAPWRTPEFVTIAERQNQLEDDAARRTTNGWVVCDTDAFATVLWHERYVGGPCPEVKALAAAMAPRHLYVLTGDEIAWEDDGMRDGEHIRHAMQQRFRDRLARQPAPWLEVRGSVEKRVDQVLRRLGVDRVAS